MFDLSGKTALVTGATGGIGEAIARTMHAAGAEVVLSGRRVEKLQALAGDLGGRTHIAPCDLSDPDQADALVGQTIEAAGKIDILIANAGVTRDKLLMQMKDEDFQDILRVNLESYFRLCRKAVRPMMKARGGRIIGITSIVGVTGNPGQSNYCASKAGMIGFTKSLAQEVASRGITANTIAPGFIESPMTDGLPEAQKELLLGQIPSGRLGQGGDIAAAAVYLASDQASYVTGQTLHVNGGMAMI
ncbi:MAG: 3-oxoacyl-[acyl-carrier-protein] reductase [Pseudomonadota bacterium]